MLSKRKFLNLQLLHAKSGSGDQRGARARRGTCLSTLYIHTYCIVHSFCPALHCTGLHWARSFCLVGTKATPTFSHHIAHHSIHFARCKLAWHPSALHCTALHCTESKQAAQASIFPFPFPPPRTSHRTAPHRTAPRIMVISDYSKITIIL